MTRKDKGPTKHLRFELTTKEYSDFWYIADLLGLSKKHEVLRAMIEKCRRLLE